MSIDLDRLERLAAEATLSEWPPAGFECRVTHDRGLLCGDGQLTDHSFFAACDPATVAALVRAVKAAQELNDAPLTGGKVWDNLDAALAPFTPAGGRGDNA